MLITAIEPRRKGLSALYLDGVFSEELTPVVSENGLSFTIPGIPANANALLIYKATVNGFAPLAPGSEIENVASIGLNDPITVSATVPAIRNGTGTERFIF